jgi:hypothetical protein
LTKTEKPHISEQVTTWKELRTKNHSRIATRSEEMSLEDGLCHVVQVNIENIGFWAVYSTHVGDAIVKSTEPHRLLRKRGNVSRCLPERPRPCSLLQRIRSRTMEPILNTIPSTIAASNRSRENWCGKDGAAAILCILTEV